MAGGSFLFPRTRGARGPAALALALLAGGCSGGRANEDSPLFTEVTDRVRLDFTHQLGPRLTYFSPEVMGAGGALLDYDGDGDLDVYLINGSHSPGVEPPREAPRNRLFRQEADGTFVDASAGSGLDHPGYGMGVAAGDYDNDGRVDVYVTNVGPNALFHNLGDGRFADVTDRAGVGDDGWGSSAAFLDYDADGWLDLYVVNYMIVDLGERCTDSAGRPDYCDVSHFEGDADRLYHNNGDGTFDDVSQTSGIGEASLKGLGIVTADLTGDGLIDIYVANDMQRNVLWTNRGDGTFVDEAVRRGVAYNGEGATEAGMGVVGADLDGDLDLDLFVTHLAGQTNTLYRNEGGQFEDATAAANLFDSSLPATAFGAVAFDIEHDGDLDLVLANGHVFRVELTPAAGVAAHWALYAQAGSVLRNERGRFVDAGAAAGSFGTERQVGRALATGDVDGDGDVDFLVTACNGRARLYYNSATKRGQWLAVAARDPALKRDVLGARITLVAGERRWTGIVHADQSYLASSEPVAHFGLGETPRVDSIEVVWPGGAVERFPGAATGRRLTVERGKGQPG